MSDQNLNVIVKLVDQASGGLKSLSDKFDGMHDSLDKTTGKAQDFTKAVTAVGLAAGTYAVTQFATYEKTMSKVQAVTESSNEEMKKMYALAQEEGQRTKYSTNEVAQAMYVLGQAGITAAQQAQILPQVLDMATAADMDLASASDIMIGTLNGMQMPLTASGHLMDVMAKSANVSAISMTDYGESMKYIAPTAAALGISLEDTSAYIAIMGNNGEKGSIATRAFGTSLANLTHPTTTMQGALDDMNISLFDSTGKFIGLQEMIRRVNDATKDMTQQDRLSAVSRLVGNESVQEMNILLATGADKFGDLSKQIKNSDGAARKMADTMMNNLSGSWQQFTGAIENVAISIGATLSQYIRPALDYMTAAIKDMAGWWAGLSPITQDIIGVVGTLVVVMGTLAFAVGAVALVVGPILSGFSMMAGVFAALSTAFSVAAGAVSTFMVAIGPVGWIILAIGAALAVLYAAWNGNWFGMRDTVMNVVNAWNGYFADLGSKVFDVVNSITTFFSNAWTAISEIAKGTWDNIANIFTTIGQVWLAINIVIIDSILQLFGTNLAEVITFVVQIWDSVKSATTTAWNAITSALGIIWDGIKLVFSTAGGAVKSTFSAMWDGIKLVATTIGSAVGKVIGDMWDGITGMFDKGAAFAGGAWKKFTDSLGSVMTATWEGIKQTIASSINWIIDKANSVIRSINSVASKTGFTIGEIPRVAFQTGGIVPGSANPGNHDQVMTALDPGELILNRSQQTNIANQLDNPQGGGGGMQITIQLSNNTFHGADTAYASQIADMIFQEFNKHASMPSF